MKQEHLPYLTPTEIIDSDHKNIQDYAVGSLVKVLSQEKPQ